MQAKVQQYEQLIALAEPLIEGGTTFISTLANVAALLYQQVRGISWVGFYLYDGEKLFLGPFQGKVACETIALGQGVCGTAAITRKTQIVDDVLTFPGHIACDPLSRSEIVIPIVSGDALIGVLDVDAPTNAHFDSVDQKYLSFIVFLLLRQYRQFLINQFK